MTRVRGLLLTLAMLIAGVITVFAAANTAIVTVTSARVGVMITPPPKSVPIKEPCLSNSRPFYLGNLPAEVKEGRRSFGPPMTVRKVDNTDRKSQMYTTPFKAITSKPARVGNEILARLCGRAGWNGSFAGNIHGGDQAFYLAFTAAYDRKDPNRPITRKEWEEGVQYLVDTGIQFRDITVERRIAEPAGYTLYMEPNRDRTKPPRIGAAKFAHWESWIVTIPVRMPGGGVVTKMFRADCGLQLMANSPDELPPALRGQVA